MVVPLRAIPSSRGTNIFLNQISNLTYTTFALLTQSLLLFLVLIGTEGFYAINNQFQANGPKGFMEFKMLENEDMYVRIDFPGVPRDGVRVFLDQSKKAVCIFADAPKEHKYDYSERNYGTSTGLVCKCCEISGFTSFMSDGVLRLLLTKSNITPQRSSCICNYLYYSVTSIFMEPFLVIKTFDEFVFFYSVSCWPRFQRRYFIRSVVFTKLSILIYRLSTIITKSSFFFG